MKGQSQNPSNGDGGFPGDGMKKRNRVCLILVMTLLTSPLGFCDLGEGAYINVNYSKQG